MHPDKARHERRRNSNQVSTWRVQVNGANEYIVFTQPKSYQQVVEYMRKERPNCLVKVGI